MPTTLAIVILNYNGAGFLRQFLPSVIEYSKGHRIIVADNASTDASVAVVEKEFPEVELLLLPRNTGYAGGYNEALKQIQATYYLLLNSDVAVCENWLTPLLSLMESSETIAACQPKILSWQNPDYFEYAGAAGGHLDLLGYPFCRGRIFDTLEKDNGQYNDPTPVFWATGACMMVRASTFHEMGGFDARFFAHMEEIDLCWRFHLHGWQVYACPQSRVYHVGGGTLPKSNPRKTYLNFRNGLWMIYKNSSAKMLAWKLAGRLLLDCLAAMQFLGKGQFGNAWAILKAHARAFTNLPYQARKKIQQNAVHRKQIPFYKGYIVWDYYVKGLREFGRLKARRQNTQKTQKVY